MKKLETFPWASRVSGPICFGITDCLGPSYQGSLLCQLLCDNSRQQPTEPMIGNIVGYTELTGHNGTQSTTAVETVVRYRMPNADFR